MIKKNNCNKNNIENKIGLRIKNKRYLIYNVMD